MPAPIAAAIGSSIKRTSRAPALNTASRIARRSTNVDLHGTQTTTRGAGGNKRFSCTLPINWFNMVSVTSKSAITPSFIGRIAEIFAGVRPSICFASRPTAATIFCEPLWRIATTVGSFNIMPRPGA